jgi:hypothetical protein
MIQIAFAPSHPIIYYKKVACLVQNHVSKPIERDIYPSEMTMKYCTLFVEGCDIC